MAEQVITNITFDNIKRGSMQLESSVKLIIPLTSFRVHDALQTILPSAGASDDLGLVGGTFGSASPTLQSGDFGGTSVTQYARALFQLPFEWRQTLKVRLSAAMLTTISDTTATWDVEAYKSDSEGGVGSDLVTDVAKTFNSLTYATGDYTLDATGLSVGDWLDLRLTFNGVDSGDAGVMKGAVGEVALIMDIRG